ncbi:MAG: septum formation initiator family protein [Rhodobacteraceae bacterium]|jgi:cell division protein FtsB|nr:septum formation initiator family protein [Paracoccaceae bacterium]MBL4559197.1 septum formation initiator family protein [Paracoccaceae bacterium]HBG97211.1 septum formation initiator precursor [Paracoccaceae bacterium]
MAERRIGSSFAAVGFALGALALAGHFAFSALQGDFGLFRRLKAEAQAEELGAELASLRAEIARMENLTHRLSDNHLDLDLLDERARRVLGVIRTDEIVIR